MGVIKEGNGGRGKERRNGPWSDESISSGEKSNAALGRGRVSGEERGGREGGVVERSALVHVQYV